MSPSILNDISKVRQDGGRNSICLCMIVKNEASIIERCLASVKPHVSRWVIMDTGSTDGTQEIIRDYMHVIPGELIEAPWVDFAHNRNQAMVKAMSMGTDYVMTIDADEVLESPPISIKLTHPVYALDVHSGMGIAPRVWLIRSDYTGRWVGSIHEDLEQVGEWCRIGGARIVSFQDGARAQDPETLNKDLQALFQMIEKEPRNPRHYYYLGATYMAGGDWAQAEKAFRIRLKMGGSDEEYIRTVQALQQIERRSHASCS